MKFLKQMIFAFLFLFIGYAKPTVQEEVIDGLLPLHELSSQLINEQSIRKAFNETFKLICKMVVIQSDIEKSKSCLEDERFKIETESLCVQIREGINKSFAQTSSMSFMIPG